MVERIEINLLPAEYRVHKKSIKLQREIFYPALGVIAFWIALWILTISIDSRISSLRSAIADVNLQIEQNKGIEVEINRLRAETRTVEHKITALRRIAVNREKWVRILEVLCRYLPDYTWLVNVEEKSAESKLAIEGRTHSFPQVARYMASLKESDYVRGVDLLHAERVDEKTNLFNFSLSCALNPDAGLPPGDTMAVARLEAPAPAVNPATPAPRAKDDEGL